MSAERRRWGWIAGCVVLAGIAVGVSAARAAEEANKELPKAVAAAVEKAFPGATIDKVGKDSEDGVAVYEVELKCKGGELEVSVTPGGVIVAVETEVKDIPEAVEAAIRDAARGGKITEMEKVEIHAVYIASLDQLCELKEPVVVYEIEYVKGDDEYEARVRADGRLLGISEEDDGDDDGGKGDDEEDDD